MTVGVCAAFRAVSIVENRKTGVLDVDTQTGYQRPAKRKTTI
jgi:hypothetical protein